MAKAKIIQVENRDGVLVLTPTVNEIFSWDKMDVYNEIASSINKIQGNPRVVVNLEGAESSHNLLAPLIGAKKEIDRRGGTLLLAGAVEDTPEAFNSILRTRIFTFAKSVDEAVKQLSLPRSAGGPPDPSVTNPKGAHKEELKAANYL